MKYRLFKRKKSNQFFFQIQTDGGDAVLESQGYDQKDARNNGLRSVVSNGGDAGKYEKKTEGGKHYFILKAGNGQEIARSVMYDNGGDADKSMALCVKEVPKLAPEGDGGKAGTTATGGTAGGTSTTTTTTTTTTGEAGKAVTEGSKLVAANRTANVNIDAPPPPKEKKPKKKRKKKDPSEKKPKKEKVYLSNGNYYFNDITYQVFRSGNDKHYFTFKNKAEKTIFLNADVRGFVTQDEAEEMVKEVFKYAPFEGNYEGKATTNGKFYFYLKNAEGKNLAKSFFYGTTDGMQAAIGELLGNEEAIAAARASAGGGAAKTATAAKAGVDEYLSCSAYSGASGWHTFTEGGEFYFSYNNEDGKSLLRSEGYTTESARDNGIESVKKNAPMNERWKVLNEDGKWFHSLKAGNHQEIARSCPLDSEPKAMNWSSYSAKKVVAKTVAPAAAAVAAVAKGNVDEYLDCAAYKGGSGFHKFEKNGEFYFGYNDDKGNTILRSEGYTSESGRDNGIESVKKNATEEKRWSTVEEGGKFFRILKAGNHQEIGRSCPADSANGPAWSWMWSSFSVASAVPKKSIPAPEKIVFAKANVDEYLECSAYSGGKGFHKFEKDGEFYFGYNDDKGNTILRSEGYTSESGRDNGIESVKKNATDEKKWSTVEEDGKYFRILKAGNHQEIGRSCPADSASGPAWSWMWSSFAVAGAVAPKSIPAAEKIEFAAPPPPPPPPAPEPVVVKVKSEEEKEDDYLPCKEYQGHNVTDKLNHIAFFKHENGQHYFVVYNAKGDVNLRSEGFQDTKTRDEELAGVLKNLKNNDMYKTVKKGKYSMRILYDKTGREVGRSCLIKAEEKKVVKAAPIVAAAAVVAAAPKVVRKKTTEEKEDDYLACKEYEGKTVTDKANNIALFKHTNGQFYFVAYKKDGSVKYRSEGFKTTEKRKEEFDGVIAYMGNKDMMKTIIKGKYRMHILYDADGREVGRSCLEKEQEKKVVKAAPVAAAAAVAAVAATQPKVKKEVDKEDDYLACKEYEGKKVNDKTNNIALFKHKNGQFYFAVYNADKTVRLRSEGFKSGKDRDVELAGVIKHMGDKSMYKTIKKGKYHMDILYDKTGREVGRSCLETEKPVVIKPTKKKVVPVAAATKVAAATTAAAATTTTAAAAKSGCAWWPWLLLLLIPLLLCFFKPEWCGCGDKAAVTNTPPPVEEVVTPPVEEVAPPPPAEVTCNCSGNSSNRIFNVPTSGTPKSLSRLGTNPEFGNSHSLDGAGFYNKLKGAYANSSRDKAFLDNLFKGMGYDGFGDATAEMFSETTIARGTAGQMGTSKAHRTIYARLDVTSDRDLRAFRIDAKNGCDMNFMKTCGNHFFYCPN